MSHSGKYLRMGKFALNSVRGAVLYLALPSNPKIDGADLVQCQNHDQHCNCAKLHAHQKHRAGS